jgi:hypothetical protein
LKSTDDLFSKEPNKKKGLPSYLKEPGAVSRQIFSSVNIPVLLPQPSKLESCKCMIDLRCCTQGLRDRRAGNDVKKIMAPIFPNASEKGIQITAKYLTVGR